MEKQVKQYFALWPTDSNTREQDQLAAVTLYTDGTLEVSVLPGHAYEWMDETHLSLDSDSNTAGTVQ